MAIDFIKTSTIDLKAIADIISALIQKIQDLIAGVSKALEEAGV